MLWKEQPPQGAKDTLESPFYRLEAAAGAMPVTLALELVILALNNFVEAAVAVPDECPGFYRVSHLHRHTCKYLTDEKVTAREIQATIDLCNYLIRLGCLLQSSPQRSEACVCS